MLKFSKKPLMIAGGCSYTDKDFTSIFHPDLDTSWDKWPAIFGKKYNYEVLNTGSSGSGNEFICQSIINAINKNPNTKLVLVLWSGWDRIQVYKKKICPLSEVNRRKRPTLFTEKNTIMYDVSKLILDNYFNLNSMLNNNMFYMWILKDFLEKRNIKYIFAQGIIPLQLTYFKDDYVKKEVYRELNNFIDHIYYDDLDIENFYGWPLFEALGGQHIGRFTTTNEDLTISYMDRHPNAKGQEELAKIFSKAYEKIYA